MKYKQLEKYKFWCQKILPLVYDDSLSYYEVLCKVVDYINNMIENQKEFSNNLDELKSELVIIQKWIDNFDTSYIEKVVREYLATMIFVEISDAGYIIYYIPDTWKDITFNTTELDIHITEYPDYG